MIDVDYPQLLENFPEHLDPNRNESASFLIWYLEHYYRLDTLEATDAVCDQRGDKGVDGIFVNDDNQTITIFAAQISQRSDRTVGDSALKKLLGSMAQFRTVETTEQVMESAKDTQVARLAARLKLTEKIETHDVRGELLSNINIDQNGLDYLGNVGNLSFIGKNDLIESYITDSREIPDSPEITFDIHGFSAAQYAVDADMKAIIVPVRGIELVRMNGIADQSLYAFNVRGPLGNTGVNRGIRESIEDTSMHRMFPLFHNGVTVIAREVEATDDEIKASGYFVVNGCQSLTALYNSRDKLTDDLRILVKFIKLDPASVWAERITRFSNNQNSVRPRDFKANSSIQIRLQNEINQHYKKEYFYQINAERNQEMVLLYPMKMLAYSCVPLIYRSHGRHIESTKFLRKNTQIFLGAPG